MQVAAEAARTDTLARLSQDVKAHIEAIHAQAATDATDLRKQADDDVVAIRDRSKAEIARIRDETEGRITQRKLALDGEIEDYNAAVEHRIEAVQASVATFTLEMAGFFAALLAETDPTRLAGMAEALPEPPVFDQPHPNDEVVGSLDVAEPVETPEPTQATDVLHGPEATFDHAAETDPTIDPRLAALGLASHFAAAEAEAAQSSVERMTRATRTTRRGSSWSAWSVWSASRASSASWRASQVSSRSACPRDRKANSCSPYNTHRRSACVR